MGLRRADAVVAAAGLGLWAAATALHLAAVGRQRAAGAVGAGTGPVEGRADDPHAAVLAAGCAHRDAGRMGAVRGARHAAATGQRVDRRARCDTHAAGELQRGGLLVGAAASVAAADGGRLRRPGGGYGGGRAFQIQRRAGDCCRAAGGRFTAGATTRFTGAGVVLDAVGGRRAAGAARGVGVVELGAGDRRDAGKKCSAARRRTAGWSAF